MKKLHNEIESMFGIFQWLTLERSTFIGDDDENAQCNEQLNSFKLKVFRGASPKRTEERERDNKMKIIMKFALLSKTKNKNTQILYSGNCEERIDKCD